MTTTVAVADGIFSIEDGQPKLLGSRCTNCGNHMFPRQSGLPQVHVRRAGRRRTRHDRHAVDLDGAGVPAEVAAVPRPDRRRLRAVRRGLRRTARPASRRGPAHRVRPRQADHRHGDGTRDRSALHRRRRQPGRHLRIRPQTVRRLRKERRHEQRRNRRHRYARVRPHRGRLGHGPGRDGHPPRPGRLRQAVVRHAVRRRRARWTAVPPTRW